MASCSAQSFKVTHRRVLGIAVPVTLAYLSTPLLGIVDTAVIGQLGNAALIGGIAVGAAIFDFVFITFNFLRASTTGLTAQAYGRSDYPEQAVIYYRALFLAVILGILVIALNRPFLEAGLYFMAPSAPVEAAVRTYFIIRVLATPFSLINYVVLGWFLGLGKAGTGLFLQTVLNGLNIALNTLLVLVFDFGVAGIAWGTLCAEAFAAVTGGLMVQYHTRHHVPIKIRERLKTIFERTAVLKLLTINRDIMVRSFALLFAFLYFTAQSTRQSDIILAANAILMHFFLFGGYFLDGLATAAEQLAGRTLGAKDHKNFDTAIRLTSLWGLGLASLLALIFWFFGAFLIDLMTTAADVRETARHFLPFVAVTPILGVMAFIMDGVFIGATWSRDMRNMMLLSTGLYLIACITLIPFYGNQGLWIAFWLFISVRGLSLWLIYQNRRISHFVD